jgi:pimeloyl-ACP methyl ester carboxylesterase
MSEDLARRISGANYQTMAELGHFPMSENPERFRSYIAPVLGEISAADKQFSASG